MRSDIDTLPHTRAHAHHAHGPSSDLSRPLFPGKPDGRLQAEHAQVLVSNALKASKNKQHFGSFEKFSDAYTPWILSLIRGSEEEAVCAFRYFNFIMTLAFEKSWKAAEEYHWLLFARIERGEYALSQGPQDWISLRKLDQLYPTKANKPARSGGEPSGRFNKENLIKCPLHGWCMHKPVDCDRTVANGGDGTKSPNFRHNK